VSVWADMGSDSRDQVVRMPVRVDSGSLRLELLLAALAVLAPAPHVIMRPGARARAVLALAPLAVLRADARARAVLACAPLAVM